ncbi:MAG: CPXCG motif-containing cysteine-rich protein [Bacteroidota bacterium]
MGEEYFFNCPYCWEKISLVIDTSITNQKYVEDCEVCCKPIEIHCTIENKHIKIFDAHSIQ